MVIPPNKKRKSANDTEGRAWVFIISSIISLSIIAVLRRAPQFRTTVGMSSAPSPRRSAGFVASMPAVPGGRLGKSIPQQKNKEGKGEGQDKAGRPLIP